MSASSTYVAIIEYAFGFNMHVATMEKGIDSTLIKIIVDKKVMVAFMANASPIIVSEMGDKFLGAQIY